jgi:signal transduction histidine kinase
MLRLLPLDGAVLRKFAGESPDTRRRARLVAAFGLLGATGGLTLAATHYLVFGIPAVHVVAPLIAGLVSLFSPVSLLTGRSLRLGGNLIAACWFVATGWGVYLRGGLASPPLMTLAAVPFIAMAIAGRGAGVLWVGVCMLEILVHVALRSAGIVLPDRMPPEHAATSNVLVSVLFGSLLLLMAVALEWLRVAAQAELAEAERSKLEAEREAQILRADRLASLGQLSASLAHEINNPLSYVLANLDYLETTATGDDQKEALRDAMDGAARVKVIVQDLKAFARGDDERLARVDLRSVVMSSVRMVAGEAKHRALMVTDLGEAPPVVASETRLGQILVNLLVNAIQAIPDGDGKSHVITVTIGTDGGGSAVLTVSDTGKGIPKELLARVTEPFFTTKPIGEGTGLGLSVCADLVRRFGGTMSIASVVGEGTTVTLTFPAANEVRTSLVDVPAAPVAQANASR